MDRVGTSEHRLEEPGEQAQVVSAVLVQPVRIPPHVTYTDVTGETPPDVRGRAAGTFHSRHRTPTPVSHSSRASHSRFTPCPTFRKRFRSLECMNKVFQCEYE